jgi:hypothetical protein
MRCTYCGLPLSPSNTSGTCPRCSAPIGSKLPSNSVQTPTGWATPQANHNYERGTGMGQPQQQSEVQYMGRPGTPGTPGAPGDTPSPTPLFQAVEQPMQQNQGWFPGQISMHTPAQTPAGSPVQNSMFTSMQTPAPSSTPTSASISQVSSQSQAGSYTSKPSGKRRSGQLGFTIAGLCVITSALLLIFVYIVSTGLPQNAADSGTATPAIAQASSTVHVRPTAATSPTLAPSPTPAFPGQQYISNAQMASDIDKNTATPKQTATTFTVGKPVYVTFTIHPNGHAGEVCLAWYLNGNRTSNFSFAVGATNTTAYSYTYYNASGQGYVELSWSSSADCSNSLVAERVQFTVNR